MGKGDRKTKRGKISIGSYGKSRPRRKLDVSRTASTTPTNLNKQESVVKKVRVKKESTKKKVKKAKKQD